MDAIRHDRPIGLGQQALYGVTVELFGVPVSCTNKHFFGVNEWLRIHESAHEMRNCADEGSQPLIYSKNIFG